MKLISISFFFISWINYMYTQDNLLGAFRARNGTSIPNADLIPHCMVFVCSFIPEPNRVGFQVSCGICQPQRQRCLIWSSSYDKSAERLCGHGKFNVVVFETFVSIDHFASDAIVASRVLCRPMPSLAVFETYYPIPDRKIPHNWAHTDVRNSQTDGLKGIIIPHRSLSLEIW